MPLKQIELHKRRSRFIDLSGNLHGKHAFAQATEWTNGDGWDFEFDTTLGRQTFSLDHTMIEILNHLMTAQESYEQH